ncbi:MAG: preprotein translocase subunit YajC [Defluviitaleaceae bacterium]|nr:preprotein translocase subunit YajC [Defluviitaleaceae bacterium]
MNDFTDFNAVPLFDGGGSNQQGQGTGTTQPAGDAQTGTEEQQGGFFTWTTILIWGLVIVAMWFMLIRPQRKREKEMREMQQSLKVGDSIVTTSGFYGKILGVGTDAYLIEFGENRGLNVWVRKSDIAGIKSPTTTAPKKEEAPATTAKEEKDKKKDK